MSEIEKVSEIEYWGVSCNIKNDKVFRNGAKLVITLLNSGNASERMEAIGLSKGGRIVRKWINTKKAYNFRPVFLYNKEIDNIYLYFDDKKDALLCIERINCCIVNSFK